MSADLTEQELGKLRQEAERSLDAAEPHKALKLLESLAQHAGTANAHALFAHRHLGELKLESNPWAAALHLRRCLQWERGNHILHALMGLAQALLGNYRAAVSAYRDAVRLSPRNPWYHHNLGHLLDVALERPEDALPHLEEAHRLEASQHEVLASLAHCLAKLGRLQDAADIASLAVALAPQNDHHRSLATWIRNEARDNGRGIGASVLDEDSPSATETNTVRGPLVEVAEMLQDRMPRAGFSSDEVEVALDIWDEYWVCADPSPRISTKAYAAAVAYAVVTVFEIHGVTQAHVADQYRVSRSALGRRYRDLVRVLALKAGDRRFRP